jgi:putative phage-type endonuclease
MLTEKQLEERINYLGSSDAAGVLGLSRWKTPLEVWAIKTRQFEPKELDSEAVELGNELEDYVARRFMKKTGKKVQRVNETLYHPDYPFLAANVDRRIVGEKSVLECKVTSAWKASEWRGEEIPQEYIIQVLHQMAIGGFTKGYIAVLIGNQDFKWKEIIRDEKVIKDIIRKEVYFWQEFVEKRQMPMTIKAQDGDVLYALYPKATEESVIELGDDASRICESIDSLEADEKVLKKEIDEQKNTLKAMLTTYEMGVTANYKISWKNQEERRIDVELLKKEEPGLYEKYSKLTSKRVLRVSVKK